MPSYYRRDYGGRCDNDDGGGRGTTLVGQIGGTKLAGRSQREEVGGMKLVGLEFQCTRSY